MYRRPKFLEVLLRIREQMARDADYDVDRFAEMVRSGDHRNGHKGLSLSDGEMQAEGSEAGTLVKTRRRRTKRNSK